MKNSNNIKTLGIGSGTQGQFSQPNELTHFIRFCIISSNGVRRELECRYCQTDRWMGVTGCLENARTIIAHILSVVAKDTDAAVAQVYVGDLRTLDIVHEFKPFLLKRDYGSELFVMGKTILNQIN